MAGLNIPKAKKKSEFDLDALMGKATLTSEEAVSEIQEEYKIPDGAFIVKRMSVENIIADPDQPRNTKNISAEYLEDLGNSILETGQIYPVIIRKNTNDNYSQEWMLVDGECRWLSVTKHPDLTELNCIILDEGLSLTEILIMQISANNKRTEMSIAENAFAYQRVANAKKVTGSTQQDIADSLGMHRVTLSKFLRLAKEENSAVIQMSADGYTQDLGTLVSLAGINDKNPEAAQKIINSLINDKAPEDLRGYVATILKQVTNQNDGDVVQVQKTVKPKLYKPTKVDLKELEGVPTLILDVKGKSIQIDLSDIQEDLKSLFN